jgi:cytoskeletal protein RodZ
MATLLRPDFGEWLRQAREERHLTLDALTQQTRIPRRHLEALEHGDLGRLPDFYQRAEVRAFARAVGVSEQLALEQLQAAVTPVEPAVEPLPKPERWFSRHVATMTLGLVFLAAGLIGLEIAERRAVRQPEVLPRVEHPASAAAPPAANTSNAELLLASTPAVPPATVAAAGTVTELVVRTHPSGARVTVNGIGWGVSPIAIRHLPPGTKRVRVSKDGYGAAEQVLALDEGRQRSVDLRLPSMQ